MWQFREKCLSLVIWRLSWFRFLFVLNRRAEPMWPAKRSVISSLNFSFWEGREILMLVDTSLGSRPKHCMCLCFHMRLNFQNSSVPTTLQAVESQDLCVLFCPYVWDVIQCLLNQKRNSWVSFIPLVKGGYQVVCYRQYPILANLGPFSFKAISVSPGFSIAPGLQEGKNGKERMER